MYQRKASLQLGRLLFLSRIGRTWPSTGPIRPVHCTAVRRIDPHEYGDDPILQSALREFRELEERSQPRFSHSNPKKIYNVTVENVQHHIRMAGNDHRKGAVLAISVASEKDLCALTVVAHFLLGLVNSVCSPENGHLAEDVYVMSRVALGATSVVACCQSLRESERVTLRTFAVRVLETCRQEHVQHTLKSNVLEGSTLVYLCKVVATLQDESATQLHLPVFVELLAKVSMEPHNFISCLASLQPHLLDEHKQFLYSAVERVDISQEDPSALMYLVLYLKQLLPRVPANAPAWVAYLSTHGDGMTLWCLAEMLELCVRCNVVTPGNDRQLLDMLSRVIAAQCESMIVETHVALLLPLVSLGRMHASRAAPIPPTMPDGAGVGALSAVASGEWLALARKLASVLLAQCGSDGAAGGLISGVRPHHGVCCNLLWLLGTIQCMPPSLFLAWLDVAMNNASRLSFSHFVRLLSAVSIFLSPSSSSASFAEKKSARHRMVHGMAYLDADWQWIPTSQYSPTVASMCIKLISLRAFNPLPARHAAEWLLRECSLAADPESWCVIAASCVSMGADGAPFAYAALPTVQCALPMAPGEACTLAWLCGPVANVLSRDGAVHCLRMATRAINGRGQRKTRKGIGNAHAIPGHLLEKLLVTHCWAGEASPIDAASLMAYSERYAEICNVREAHPAALRTVEAVKEAFGATFACTGAQARLDYLPVSVMLLFDQSKQCFVAHGHLRQWLSLTPDDRCRSHLRLICILNATDDKFMFPESFTVDLLSLDTDRTAFSSGTLLPADRFAVCGKPLPMLASYCRALRSRGAHAVLPLHSRAFSKLQPSLRLHIGHLAASNATGDVYREVADEGLFEPYMPPWQQAVDDATWQHCSNGY